MKSLFLQDWVVLGYRQLGDLLRCRRILPKDVGKRMYIDALNFFEAV